MTSRPSMLLTKAGTNGRVELLSPAPGWYIPLVTDGQPVRAGDSIGVLEVLGRKRALVLPAECRGIVSRPPALRQRARVAVGYGQPVAMLDPIALAAEGATSPPTSRTGVDASAGIPLLSPTSGRFYRRAAPDKPAFVDVGQRVGYGHTLCLIEVMKTFHRVVYGGDGFPLQASVVDVLAADEADVVLGQPLFVFLPDLPDSSP